MATKPVKARSLRATIYPQGGGQPYEQDVAVAEDGTFDLGEAMTYKVTKGSVCLGLDGISRTIVHEGNPQTVNVAMLQGDLILHPSVLHAVAHNNLLKQQADLESQRGVLGAVKTWGTMILVVCGILVLVWMTRTIGSGLEGIADALSTMAPAAPAAADPATHATIAPIQG